MAVLLPMLLGCNDKYIYHDCGCVGQKKIDVDWGYLDAPGNGTVIIIIDKDGNQSTFTEEEGSDSFYIDLDDGKYDIIVGGKEEGVTYDGNKVTTNQDEDGFVSEPPGFAAGETSVTIEDGRIVSGEKVIMVLQSREFVVKVRIISGMSHFRNINGFECLFDGATLSRDISYGFAPYSVDRPLQGTVSGILKMEFAKDNQTISPEILASYTAGHRLLGIDPNVDKSFTLYYSTDVKNGESQEFYTLDATDMITDFHTLGNVSEPYVLIIELGEDPISGGLSIIDWKMGDTNDLIATEK